MRVCVRPVARAVAKPGSIFDLASSNLEGFGLRVEIDVKASVKLKSAALHLDECRD